MKTLKFIIPRNAASITALIDSLNDELNDLDVITAGDIDTKTTAAPAPAASEDTTGTEDIEQVNNDNVVQLKPSTGVNVVVIAPGEKATGAAGIVEVDADGIPWDSRIHASSRATLKRGGTWKIARNTPDELVESVKVELRATMAAAPAPAASETNDDTTTSTATPAPAPAPAAPAPAPAPAPAAPAPAPIYIVEGSGEFTAEQLKASSWTDDQIATLPVKQVEAAPANNNDITFPELMAAITAGGIDEATILSALPEGITALPLLAARPDLVPAVHAILFSA